VQATVMPHRITLNPRTLGAGNFWSNIPVQEDQIKSESKWNS
jgi:hypothetical protein